MSKRKKTISPKIILSSIVIFFTALLLLSLPVLFNYNSIQNIIEKKVSSEFKINLKILGDISLKIFPAPHYFVKKANLDLNIDNDKSSIIETNNLKIFIPIKELYARSNIKVEGIEIEKANIYFKFNDILDFRNHLYYKINKPIHVKESKLFLIDKNNKTILISPIKKINYFINTKSSSKELNIKGNIFDIDYDSSWKRSYKEPKKSINEIKFKNPNLFMKNFFSFENKKSFSGKSLISFMNEDIIIDYLKKDKKIFISSPDQSKNQKIKLSSEIELEPFYIDATVDINNKDINFLIDNLLYVILNSNEYLGNINGKLNLIVNNLKNSIINNGKINLYIKEKTIKLENSLFEIKGIGKIKSDFRYYEKEGELIFVSENLFEIKNKKEFSRKFQLSFKNLKNINKIYFDIEKNIDSGEIFISNIYLNKIDPESSSEDFFIIKNLQGLKALIRKFLL
tara:strand:- start:1978 stop:3342 length:1365 start_codon:yes stop_codon:yes gene_type:complete